MDPRQIVLNHCYPSPIMYAFNNQSQMSLSLIATFLSFLFLLLLGQFNSINYNNNNLHTLYRKEESIWCHTF